MNHLNRPVDRNEPPVKRHKSICRDVSFADGARYGTMNDDAFFDKVRKALRTSDVYDNFLRCLTLYNQEIVLLVAKNWHTINSLVVGEVWECCEGVARDIQQYGKLVALVVKRK